ATLWLEMAQRLGLEADFVPGDWRHGVDPKVVEDKLRADSQQKVRAVCVVHNETSTGVTTRVAEVRAAIDRVGHPALFLVDTISSLASIDYRHDDWKVDVTVAGSQKGLMLPPGLSFNAVSQKALEASRSAGSKRSYWDWAPMLRANESGFFPYTPAGNDADQLRAVILERFDMSLGQGLGKLKGKMFRIGHLGAFNDLTLCGTLAGVEMGLALAGVPHQAGGVTAAMQHLASTSAPA